MLKNVFYFRNLKTCNKQIRTGKTDRSIHVITGMFRYKQQKLAN
jgi:hypothetical protein